MKKNIKWGIIGYGNASLQFINNFKINKNSKIEAIASISKDLSRKINKIKSVKFYKSYIELLKNDNIDIVYISLPNNLHKFWSIKALQHGKNILIEKPATICPKDFRTINNFAKKKKLLVFEGIYFRSHSNIKKLIKLLKKINLKNVNSIKASYGNDALGGKKLFGIRLKRPKKNKRLFNPTMYGGAIWDTGCYPLNFVNILIKLFTNEEIKKKNILFSKKKIGLTRVDMKSEIHFKVGKINIILETSIIKKLENSVNIESKDGSIKISNLLNIGKELNVALIKKNKLLKNYNIKSNENIYEKFIKEINYSIIKKKNCLTFPSITNRESFENIKILEKWRNS